MPDATNSALMEERRERRRGPRFDGDLMGALEASRDLMCVTIDGRITAINSAGLALLGAEALIEVERRHFLDFLVAEQVGGYGDDFLNRNAFRADPVCVRMERLNGQIRDVELFIYRAREVANGAAVVLGRDVSETSRLVSTVQETEIRFRMLVENSRHLVCHCRGDVIDYINRSGVSLLGGAAPAEFVGRPVWELFSDDYRAIFTDNVALLLRESGGLTVKLACLDGGLIDAQLAVTVFPSAEVVDYMIEATDISAHNRAVGALRQFNEELERRVLDRTAELEEQRKVAEDQHRLAVQARHFVESLLDAVPSPLWYKDGDGRYQAYNRAFRDAWGIDGNRWIGHQAIEVAPFDDAKLDETMDYRLLGSDARQAYEATSRFADGSDRHVLVNKTAFYDAEGAQAGVIGLMVDISDRKVMERELRRLATTDALTGTLNRRQFLIVAGLELERAQRHLRPLSVLMLDIDHFKHINDSHGHALGDDALRLFVSACAGILRENDVFGRLGGEEFAVLLPETAQDRAADVAERLRERVAGLSVPSCGGAVVFTTSIGVTQAWAEDATIDVALMRADEALYQAKNGGRNRVVLSAAMVPS
ncbi:MAG TPA: diguanylate cyclase [Patescibacteria group bacterium]|nr:diguanylate cyclase [Patescibacteria group bacterium]